jgi:MFS family permease
MLVDRWSGGDPRRAGIVYAMNIVGCVVGPLLASFVLLPWLGERGSLLALSAPLAAVARSRASRRAARARRAALVAAARSPRGSLWRRGTSSESTRSEVRRDYAATVVAATTTTGRPICS